MIEHHVYKYFFLYPIFFGWACFLNCKNPESRSYVLNYYSCNTLITAVNCLEKSYKILFVVE